MCLLISSILGCYLQDTILVIPPYPYCIEEVPQDVPLEDCMLAPSCCLPATFVQNMEEPRRIQLTDTALGGLSVEECDDRKDAAQKVRVER